MTFDQLKIFLAVAEREHMTRAAEYLNLTQSAVSGAIAALEARHGLKLFHRVGRRIELTDAGKIFAVEAKKILATVNSAEATLADLCDEPRGTLSIFASQTIASYWLPQHLIAFQQTYPQIELQLEAGNTAECVRAVNAGLVDLGFIEGAIDDPGICISSLAQDRLVVVVGNEHPLAHQSSYTLKDLTGLQWILRERGSGTRSSFETGILACGLGLSDLNVVMQMPSNEGLCTAVTAGDYATAVSETVAQAGAQSGRFSVLPFELPSRAFSLIRQRERHQSRASQEFSGMLRRAFGAG